MSGAIIMFDASDLIHLFDSWLIFYTDDNLKVVQA